MTKQDAFERFKETKKEAKVLKKHQDEPIVPPSDNKPVKVEKVEKAESKPTSSEGPENWTPDEQKLLEAAMKKFTAKEGDRWNKIATQIPGRSKQDCVDRYKYLVEFFKRQKAK